MLEILLILKFSNRHHASLALLSVLFGELTLRLRMHHLKGMLFITIFTSYSSFTPRYRYDGLYKITKVRTFRLTGIPIDAVTQAWREPGKTGHLLCRFSFQVRIVFILHNRL